MDTASIAASQMTTTGLPARLVSSDTTSRGTNRLVIGLVQDCLDRSGEPYQVSSNTASGNQALRRHDCQRSARTVVA